MLDKPAFKLFSIALAGLIIYVALLLIWQNPKPSLADQATVVGSANELTDLTLPINQPEPVKLKTYQEILGENTQPAIQPDADFPTAFQFQNGCFAFAVDNVVQYKFQEKIDLLAAEKAIAKPRSELWTADYIKDFLAYNELQLEWENTAEKFFELLAQGEPLVIQYEYPIDEDKRIGHLVAAYSFDEQGVWISETLSGQLMRLDYDQVFDETGLYTQFAFAQVLKQ